MTVQEELDRAFDTLYGFILSQEIHVRGELFKHLDTLRFYAEKSTIPQAGPVDIADPAATLTKTDTKPVSNADECPECHRRSYYRNIEDGQVKCRGCGHVWRPESV